MAPEVLRDRRYSLPVDVWSAGVMLFVMLTGARVQGDRGAWEADETNGRHARPLLRLFCRPCERDVGSSRLLASGCWTPPPPPPLSQRCPHH